MKISSGVSNGLFIASSSICLLWNDFQSTDLRSGDWRKVYISRGEYMTRDFIILFFGDEMTFFSRNISFFLMRCIAEDDFYIFFYMIHLSFNSYVFMVNSPKVCLEKYIHRIEKKWYVEYRIQHSDDLPCYSHRDEITKADSCRCYYREIESIKIAFTYRMSLLKLVHENSTDKPTREEYESDNYKFAMMYMKHGMWVINQSDIFYVLWYIVFLQFIMISYERMG